MKTIAYYALHYGAEYLAHSVRSVVDHVDEIHVLYTNKPSFGHGTNLVCPDTEERLHAEAQRFCGTQKLHWHRIESQGGEGQHRDQLRGYVDGNSVILHIDADELWDSATLARSIRAARDTSYWSLRAYFMHFWRSFGWVCTEAAMPERLFNWTNSRQLGAGYLNKMQQPVPVLHFGYAQSEAIMRYKWQIHGHQAELRANWFEEKFLGWKPGELDVHPTCKDGFWNPRQTTPEENALVKTLLNDHPYFGKEIIR